MINFGTSSSCIVFFFFFVFVMVVIVFSFIYMYQLYQLFVRSFVRSFVGWSCCCCCCWGCFGIRWCCTVVVVVVVIVVVVGGGQSFSWRCSSSSSSSSSSECKFRRQVSYSSIMSLTWKPSTYGILCKFVDALICDAIVGGCLKKKPTREGQQVFSNATYSTVQYSSYY